MTDKKKMIMTGVCLILFLIGAVYFHAQVSSAIILAGKRCLISVLPSLYFFSILAAFSVQSGLLDALAKPFQKFCRKWLKIDAVLLMIIFFSQIGGYPTGAQLVHNLYQEGRISEQQEQELLCVCMGCGFGFLLATVGGNQQTALFIWLMMSIPVLLIGMWKIRYMILPESEEQHWKALAVCITDSVGSAAAAMIKIMSMIIAFSAVMGMAEAIFSDPGDLIRSILEISHAAEYARHGSLSITAALLSFGGLCVHLQIAAVCENHLLWGKFMLYRLLMAGLTYGLCFLCMKYLFLGDLAVFLPETAVSSAQDGNMIPGCCLMLMSVFVLKKYHFFQKSLTNAEK